MPSVFEPVGPVGLVGEVGAVGEPVGLVEVEVAGGVTSGLGTVPITAQQPWMYASGVRHNIHASGNEMNSDSYGWVQHCNRNITCGGIARGICYNPSHSVGRIDIGAPVRDISRLDSCRQSIPTIVAVCRDDVPGR